MVEASCLLTSVDPSYADCQVEKGHSAAMNFDFSDELKQLRDQARRFLAEQCPTSVVRHVLDGGAPYAAALWRGVSEMGWVGAAIPAQFGGAGLGYEGLCVLAEEVGRAVAPIPFASSAYLAAEAILVAGSNAQKRRMLPKVADGSAIGCFALAEGSGNPGPSAVRLRAVGGRLTGSKWPVMDGGVADFAIVAARDESSEIALYLVELAAATVNRRNLATIDPSRNQARIEFGGTDAEKLDVVVGWPAVQRLLERAAILVAFEQIGGADACLDMARGYAQERYAFGRPIGSFQAIKHKLADVYVANELARSNAYYGAWALSADAAELPLAAASARVSATEAFQLASKENIQTHGGVGFTWDVDCHLYYRRSKQLALALGAAPYWKHRLVELIETRNAG
jgi:acyl-CoA dehydrogenase